jgi:RimJ/RimL family protein N-acetyltransferase
MSAPTLSTARLVLRSHRPDDLDACAAMWGDGAVARFIGGAPSTREQTWRRMLTYAGLWPFVGYGYWAIVDAGDGAYLGDVGFARFKRALGAAFDDAPEMGWALSPRAQGRGYASEAVQAALAWAQAALPGRIVCMIAPENAPSLRVAARCGFTPFDEATYVGAAAILLERR